MPTRLADNAKRRFQARVFARQLNPYKATQAASPWLGFVPDLPVGALPLGAASRMENLQVRGGRGGGEFLVNSDGFVQVDTARLPLGEAALPSAVGGAVTHLTEMLRTNSVGARTGEFDLTPIAVTAAVGGVQRLYRISPVTGLWTPIAFSAGLGTEATGGRDGGADFGSMPQSCFLPSGAAARTAGTGAIAEPCMDYTNNVDDVYVFPAGTGLHTYEELTNQFGGAFKALSVASWEGRVFFLNTSESGTRRHQRIRWTPLFTADPDPAGPGAGAFDIVALSGEGLRMIPLGPFLACYFSDGVVFLERSGQVAAPHRARLISQYRGLLGPNAVCAIDANVHFGIFRDGWFLVDASGRFQEVGRAQVGNTDVNKWRETFYNRIDTDNLQRLYCAFDQRLQNVRISVKPTASSEVSEVWTYDLRSDRVSLDTYEATCWGEFTAQLQTATAWSAMVDTWDSVAGSWGDYGARFGHRSLVHGRANGFVYIHDPSFTTYDGANPTWVYESILTPGTSPRFLKAADRVLLEYVNRSQPSVTLGVRTDVASEAGTVATNQGTEGQVHLVGRHFRTTGQHLGITVTGAGPVAVRSLELDYQEIPAQERL